MHIYPYSDISIYYIFYSIFHKKKENIAIRVVFLFFPNKRDLFYMSI